MHYGFLSSKRNRRGGPPAIQTIPPHMPVGEIVSPDGRTNSITPGDADTVARMFGLIPTAWTVSTNPLGLTVVVDGQEVTTPAVFDWEPGTEHTLSVPSPQAQPGGRYWFGRWSDGDDGGAASRTVIATVDTTLYEANFVAAHEISTRVRPEGAGVVTIGPDDSDGYYPLRSRVTMSAEPTSGSGFSFLRWEIGSDYPWQFLVTHEAHGASANPARTYAMPGLEYTAVFTREPIFRVQSNVDPTTVEIHGREYRTPVSLAAGSLPSRVTVSLGRDFLENDKGYRDRFRSWSDGGEETHAVDVSRTEDTVLKLTVDVERRLETRASTHWKGSVLTMPPAEDGFYPDGTEVRLRAVPIPSAKFVGWNGDVAGRDPTTSVVMDDGKLAEAVFVRDAAELGSGVATPVSLQWRGTDLDFAGYYVRMPSDASGLEVRFDSGSATSGAEAGLWVTDREMFPNWVRHQDAHRVLRDGVATLEVSRPRDRRPTAWFILIRAAEADDSGTRMLEGRLLATVIRDADRNRAPQAAGTLADGTLTVGGSALVVDAYMAFSDPDGDALTYAAVSSSPGVAAAAVAGDTLTVTPVRPGSATITVTATDPGGLSATQTFAVTVTPPDNRPPTAVGTLAPLTVGSGGPAVSVEVAAAFRDPDGDLLTYTAASSAPGVAAVSTSGSTVAVEPVGAGTAVVTVTATDPGGLSATQTFAVTVAARAAFTDHPIRPGVTPIKAVHFIELRARVDALRARSRLPAFPWTDPALVAGVTPVRRVHLTELRSALDAVYDAAGRPRPAYADARAEAGMTRTTPHQGDPHHGAAGGGAAGGVTCSAHLGNREPPGRRPSDRSSARSSAARVKFCDRARRFETPTWK